LFWDATGDGVAHMLLLDCCAGAMNEEFMPWFGVDVIVVFVDHALALLVAAADEDQFTDDPVEDCDCESVGRVGCNG
jgi:hypothetical protein